MKSKFCILLVFILGMVIVPKVSYACGSKADTKAAESCCKKESKSVEKKSTCKAEKHTNNGEKHNCNGKCNHSTCGCSYISTGCIVPNSFSIERLNIELNFKNHSFKHFEAHLPSGFNFIWSPPNIGQI